jgi:superfamily I DNA/RNA helicase
LNGPDRFRVDETGIKIQTIHSSKGLQYRAVIVLWADLLPGTFHDSDPDEERRLVYVALTRAEDYLFIIHSEQSEFIDRIHQSGKVMVS